MNTCGNCAHHRMTGPLAKSGFGHCAARPDIAMRAAICTSEGAWCRIGLFKAKKQDDAVGTPKIAPRGSQAPLAAPEGPF